MDWSEWSVVRVECGRVVCDQSRCVSEWSVARMKVGVGTLEHASPVDWRWSERSGVGRVELAVLS